MKSEVIVVCIKGFIAYRFTKGKKYSVMNKLETKNLNKTVLFVHGIRIIDDYNNVIRMDKLMFDKHFKYLSDMREDKLKELGI
jgi:hypothetical protein